ISAFPGGDRQPAQQDSFVTSVVKVWAVSFNASAMVRYGAQLWASRSTVIPAVIAYPAAVIRSPAPSASACTPKIRPVSASATILASPRVSRLTSARATLDNASVRHRHRYPAVTASASVSPTAARAGLVNVSRGTVA